MNNIRRYTLAVLLAASFAFTSKAHAQKTDFQSWNFLSATVNLDSEKRWFTYTEVQPRIGDDVSRLERLLIRPALGYNVNDKVAVYLGYAWTPTVYELLVRG